jgi:hypothetical protein
MTVYATIDSEMLERMKLAPSAHILSVEKGRNFEMVAQLLGQGTELPRTTHADGAETSWTLYFYPDIVQPGYERFPQSPSSRFLEVLSSGDRTKNPSGSGGFVVTGTTNNVSSSSIKERPLYSRITCPPTVCPLRVSISRNNQ